MTSNVVLLNLRPSDVFYFLVLIVLRFFWRITHPVAPESSLPPWQRLTSEAVHWLLYKLMFAVTMTGWLFASFRGWPVSFFHLTQLPMLASESGSLGAPLTAGIRRRVGHCLS